MNEPRRRRKRASAVDSKIAARRLRALLAQASKSTAGERVANLGKQNHFLARRRGRRRGRGSGPLQGVDPFYHEEKNEGDDEEIDRHGEEIAVGEHRTLLFRVD